MSDRQHASDRPLVTIGMPVYNGERYLAEALESALAQDYTSLEVVLCDNASTDDTEQIVRRFASDPRLRYIRNPANIGSRANFDLTLAEAQGKYFTWLAHDDVLSDPRYISLAVEQLEVHPDVVLVASAFALLDLEGPGSTTVVDLSEIHPDRPWREARKALLDWPSNSADYAVYGVFRRETLVRVPIKTRKVRGRPTVKYWVRPFLAEMCVFGRVVALPKCQRGYRILSDAATVRLLQDVSPCDVMLLGLQVKLEVLWQALRQPGSLPERLEIFRFALGTLFRENLKLTGSYGSLIEERERELGALRSAAGERAQLIQTLRGEIEKRREIVRTLGRDIPGATDDEAAETRRSETDLDPDNHPLDERLQRFHDRRASWLDFFRIVPAWHLALPLDIGEEIGRARAVCDRQLEVVERLSGEAEALLQAMQGPAGSQRETAT